MLGMPNGPWDLEFLVTAILPPLLPILMLIAVYNEPCLKIVGKNIGATQRAIYEQSLQVCRINRDS